MGERTLRSLGTIVGERLSHEVINDRQKPLTTGFAQLDRYLSGGISPGLIVLGAGPSQGKSTICLQIAEHVSRAEDVPVLYFSLEMTEDRIAAKTMTMHNFRPAADKLDFPDGERAQEHYFSARDLFNPEQYQSLSVRKRQQLDEARKGLGENGNLYIIDKPYCARQIFETVSDFVAGYVADQVARGVEEKKAKKPLVIVDYLQILPLDPNPKERLGLTDKQLVDENLKKMVELAHKGLPVILISSLSRGKGNYGGKRTGPLAMDSFKETGSIEYSADVMLGLQFYACHASGGCNPQQEKEKYPREMELVILKQRYGPTDVSVRLRYYAEFDYMEEIPEEEKPAEQPKAAPAEAPEPAAKPPAEPEAPKQEPTEPVVEQKKKKPVEVAYMNNTKLAYEIRNGHWRSGREVQCNVAARGKEPRITKFQIDGELSCFDCDVADAVYSILRGGRRTFLLRHVLCALTGDDRQTLTGQKRETLRASLERLMKARIRIDCTQEMSQMRQKPELTVLAGPFLAAKEEKGRYTFLDDALSGAMPLYYYGQETNQMIAFPRSLLAVRPEQGRKIPDTTEQIMIKRYLLRRLEVIRKGKAGSAYLRQVTYYNNMIGKDSGMLAVMGLRRADYETAGWQNKLAKTHAAVKRVLDGLQRCGYIAQYREMEQRGMELPENVHDPFDLEWEDGLES